MASKKSELKDSKIVLAFNSTPNFNNVKSIIENGFDISLTCQNKKNGRNYGYGIYFLEYSSTLLNMAVFNSKE